jgi:Zn-dependent protease
MSWDDLTRRRTRAVRPSPVFLGVVAIAAVAGVLAWRDNSAGSRAGDFAVFVMVLALWIVSLSLHEFAHAYAAFRAGDRSVEAAGYLTLNPLRYAHPVLSILLPLLFIVAYGFGLPGGAVYLHRHAFRTRASQSLAAAAGPLVNLALAIGTLAVVHAELPHSDHVRFWTGLAFFGLLQVTAAIFNLLPVPGLDGWAILEPYLAPETVRGAEPVKPWGLLGVFVLLQVQQINTAFFNLVYRVYEISGLDRITAEIGRQVFRFWQRQPL